MTNLESSTAASRSLALTSRKVTASNAEAMNDQPQSPLAVTFRDGEQYVVEFRSGLEQGVEWLDTRDHTAPATVEHALGRPVEVRMEILEIQVLEVENDGQNAGRGRT